MGEKIFNKVIATSLIITLTLANVLLLGSYTSKSYAGSDLETNDLNVEFDSYFKNETEKLYEITSDINNESENIYFYINVKEGYLENPKIEIKNTIDGNSVNFELLETETDTIKNINKNVVELNQINKNQKTEIKIPIKANKKDTYNLSNLDTDFKVVFSGTFVNEKGKTKQIEKEIQRRVIWTAQINAILNHSISKYIPFENNGEKMLLVEENINSGIEGNVSPIKSTNIQIEVPNINGKQPVDVRVRANSTKATNGKEIDMSYNYNKEKNTINIVSENNPDENQTVAWKKNCMDQYVITYIYKEDISDGIDDDIKIQLKEQNKIEVYQKDAITTGKDIADEIELKEITGSVVNTEITGTKSLDKGYIYLNNNSETEYKTMLSTDISYSDIVNEISIYGGQDRFITKNEEIDNVVNNTYYKSTKISKENFDRLLGEDGFIQIYNNNEIISVIDKNTLANENGDLIAEYSEKQASDVRILTSKPKTEGRLKLINTKAIKSNLPYSSEDLKNFGKLLIQQETEASGQKSQSENTINLEETITKATISINKYNLVTLNKNENVEFKITLVNNKTKYDLYKNPLIRVELPKEIEEFEVKQISLSNAEWLNVENTTVYRNENGNLELQIKGTGEQTEYNLQDNSNIIINTDITVNKYTPSTEEIIKMIYSNEKSNIYENNEQQGYSETKIKYEAPTGMLTIDQLQNYNANNESVTALLGETQAGLLETNTGVQAGKITATVINNTGADINNVSIIGRIPFANNKNIKTGEDLGSNFDTTIKKEISVLGVSAESVVIYYSDNGEATSDLEQASNNWQTEVTDFTNIKSYLIVLKDYIFPKAQSVTFEYEISIPENLENNKTSYGMYVVSYKINETENQIASTPIGITTGKGPDVKVELTATRAGEELTNNAEVYAGEIIKYKVTATNEGTETATNVTITAPIPEGTTYVYISPNHIISSEYYLKDTEVKEQIKTVDQLEPGESIQYEYEVMVNNITDENQTVALSNKAVATGQINDNQSVESNEINITAKYGEISVVLKPRAEVYDYKVTGELVAYEVYITNISNKDVSNIEVAVNIPSGLEYVEFGESDGESFLTTGTLENGIALYQVKEIKQGKCEVITLTAKVKENTDLETQQISLVAVAEVNNNTYKSNRIGTILKQIDLQIIQTSSVTSEYVKPGDELQYKFNIKNPSTIDINDITFTDNIPKELQITDIEFGVEKMEIEDKGIIKAINLKAGENIVITITTKVEAEENIRNTKIENIAAISSNILGRTIESNKITHTIQLQNNQGDHNQKGEEIYKISGTAWKDENENGMRDSEEKVIPDVLVGLINVETLEFAETEEGIPQIMITDVNGKYVFSGVTKGKYAVIVGIDESMYKLTVNNKDGVDENLNSDIYLRKYNIEGEEYTIPSSNDLIIENTNISNIDIGLIEQAKFDLKLDKYVNKIIVQNKKGTKTYQYGEETLAKVELDRKYINNTNVIIEYKIKVTNEGEVDGYVRKIADYLPENAKFSTELNKDWYVENNIAYSTSLANEKIAPGESKEIILTLTKATTDSNTGIINNRAEIYEHYNQLGVYDTDSRPGNKVTSEDDYGKADVILGIKTGRMVLYLGLMMMVLIVSATGIYFIKKKI